MLYVTVSNVACIIGYQSPYILIQFGWLVSWFYLRFIKLNEGGEFRGDRSETFAFAAWFPPFLQYAPLLFRFLLWGASADPGRGGRSSGGDGQRSNASGHERVRLGSSWRLPIPNLTFVTPHLPSATLPTRHSCLASSAPSTESTSRE